MTKRDLVVAAITAAIVILIGGVIVGIAGIGGGDETEAAAPTSSVVRTSAAVGTTAARTANPDIHQVGVPVTKGGVTMTVNEVTTPASVPTTKGPDRTPQSGGKYVRLDTTIKNDGLQSMDLTCSFDVQVVLVDRERRQFDAVDKKYEIDGNPGCNDGLQPGFAIGMAFVFEVPADAEIKLFGFGDPNIQFNDLTWITLSP